jgi:hypothetical protein
MIATGLTKKVPELEIPIYFFGGIYDYTCSYTLAKDYLEKLTVNCAFFEEEKHMSQKKFSTRMSGTTQRRLKIRYLFWGKPLLGILR